MKKTILRAFDVIIEDRVDNFAYRKLSESADYQEVDSKVIELKQRFTESLKEESAKELLDELESLSTMRESMYLEFAYRQGLEDSLEIHKELNALGIATQYKGGF